MLCDPARPAVLFIVPEPRLDEYLGVGYLAAALRRSKLPSVTLQCGAEGFEERLIDALRPGRAPLLVGIPWLYIFSEPHAVAVARRVKALAPHVPVAVGGHPATFEYVRILARYPEIDFVVRGEGEASIVELVVALATSRPPATLHGLAFRDQSGQVVVTTPREQIANVDGLPFPARNTLEQVLACHGDRERVLVRLIGSRGCYARCEFCSMVSFYSLDGRGMRWRARSPESIVREIAGIVERYGVRRFWFADDEFIGPLKIGVPRALCLAALLREARLDIEFGFDTRANGVTALSIDDLEVLRDAGLRMVAIGIESGSQDALRRMNKAMTVETNREAVRRLRAAGVDFRYGFIMFDVRTTTVDIRQNIEFLRFADPHRICNTGPFRLLNAEFPEVGTPLFRQLGLQSHQVDVIKVADFPRVDEEQLGYRFADQHVGRYRKLLLRLAEGVVEPSMIPRGANESPLEADVWYGINKHPRNVAAMEAFLDCMEWLLDHATDGDDELLQTKLAVVFKERLDSCLVQPRAFGAAGDRYPVQRRA